VFEVLKDAPTAVWRAPEELGGKQAMNEPYGLFEDDLYLVEQALDFIVDITVVVPDGKWHKKGVEAQF
jgi:hypothetical protein